MATAGYREASVPEGLVATGFRKNACLGGREFLSFLSRKQAISPGSEVTGFRWIPLSQIRIELEPVMQVAEHSIFHLYGSSRAGVFSEGR